MARVRIERTEVWPEYYWDPVDSNAQALDVCDVPDAVLASWAAAMDAWKAVQDEIESYWRLMQPPSMRDDAQAIMSVTSMSVCSSLTWPLPDYQGAGLRQR